MKDISLSTLLLVFVVLAILVAVIKPVLMFAALCLAVYTLFRSVVLLVATAQRMD